MKDHHLWKNEYFGTEPPCITYELRPLINPKTNEEVTGLYSAWVILNNPGQLNLPASPRMIIASRRQRWTDPQPPPDWWSPGGRSPSLRKNCRLGCQNTFQRVF